MSDVTWTQQGETLWTGRGEYHDYTAVQVGEYGLGEFPWALRRIDPDSRRPRRKGEPYRTPPDTMRVWASSSGICASTARPRRRTPKPS